ncbi:hypothetical protein KUV75_04060 [Qipengyuania gaetbuli]|uniref:hypothetical protein n=1 Tax=Qipengyuania gaetbuli TaxID=266952 RepID=UPI001C99F3A1|nr:hypothetical protein [Qipengyuania gaetbuli]MBY6014075.1 hypothetical protein [Qipengyuania gaetbuli]
MEPHDIQLRRKVLEWRDEHSTAATLELNRLWLDVKPLVAEKLAAVSWRSALAEPNRYITREIDPFLAEQLAPKLEKLVSRAQQDLKAIARRHFELNPSLAPNEGEENHLGSAIAILSGIAPLAGGLAMGIALPSFAIVSGTTAFGLVATSTVSLPIVLGGVAAAGALLATGVVNTSKLHSYSAGRMMKRVEDHVRRSLLLADQSASPPSVLGQLINAYDAASEAALGEPV